MIMNIVSLKSTTKQYRVIYDINDETFIMHKKEVLLKIIELQMY